MKRRILWLFNHTTLRSFEVPMLIDMGFEVFTPKIYQYEYGDLSASVAWEYDKILSIPPEALEKLNQTDFYQEQISPEIVEIMNQYFDIVILGAFVPQLRMMVRAFQGIFIFQAFGLYNSISYTKVFSSEYPNFLEEIKALGSRFWFAASYENLHEIEDPYFQRQYVYLPIGLKKDRVDQIWTGGDEHILFIGPKIMTNPYYKQVYTEFKRDFGDIPHFIGGAQMIPVNNDPAVLGFVPKEQFDDNMRHLAAMFYHSREKRHLHYHPLEAVANGMPLVFMSGGMLDNLGGTVLPGRCRTVAQAHRMLSRLSRGDMALAKKIIAPQGILLEKFSRQFCEKQWRRIFDVILTKSFASLGASVEKERKRIALIIPKGYTGGVLDFSIRLALAIQAGAKDAGDQVEVILYHHDEPTYRARDYFYKIRDSKIPIRTYKWGYKDEKSRWARNLERIKGIEEQTLPSNGYTIEDGIANLQDCDLVIFTSDRLPTPYILWQRYAVVVHDVIQRYVPEMFSESYEYGRQAANRKAEFLLVTTPPMRTATIQYVGVSEQKVRMIPQLFEELEELKDGPIPSKKNRNNAPYFHWGTNTANHKNHLKALNALSDYYAQGGTLRCYMTGAHTKAFDPKYKELTEADGWVDYINQVREYIASDPALRKNLIFGGEMARGAYLQILKNAKFTFHPGYGDNGNGVCVEAAQLGVPALSSDYPPMRYMDQRMELHCSFCDYKDPKSMAKQLLYMEQNAQRIAGQMPDSQHYQKFTWQGQYQEIYAQIRSMVRGY